MTSTTSDWIEIQVTTSLDAGELLALLDDPVVQGAWQDDQAIHLYWPAGCWTPDHLARLKWALQQLEGADNSFPEIQVQSLPNQDWNRLWARSVKPLQIGSRIVIRPSWEEVAVRPDQIEIVLAERVSVAASYCRSWSGCSGGTSPRASRTDPKSLPRRTWDENWTPEASSVSGARSIVPKAILPLSLLKH